MLKDYELIVTIVKRGLSDKIVEASREHGAGGGTIIYGRGTGGRNPETIMGIEIQPEKEIIFTLAETAKKNAIMKAICESASLSTDGHGICFSLPTNSVVGLEKIINNKDDKEEKNN